MIKIENTADCCGCSACMSICPHDAITMKPDALGFLYPVVGMDKCIDCGLCEKVCAFNDQYDISENFTLPVAYAARHKDTSQLALSRSGAVFVALSDYILDNGGVVYGAGYVDHFRVCHKRATTREQRDEFRGSKYVQSDPADIFRQVKTDLKAGMTVMFTGTPCQTAGLHSYIPKSLHKSLILVDIICHGTPSPYIWRDYLAYIEKKTGKTAVEVSFRDKSEKGWYSHEESFTFSDGTKIYTDAFRVMFYKEIMSRPSCGKCEYANLRRPSDLTLGDFWGWQKVDPEINKDNRGISLLLVNTPAGAELLEKVTEKLQLVKVNKLEQYFQPNLYHPSKENKFRARFEQEYASKGFKYIYNHYADAGWRYKVVKLLGKAQNRAKKILGYE